MDRRAILWAAVGGVVGAAASGGTWLALVLVPGGVWGLLKLTASGREMWTALATVPLVIVARLIAINLVWGTGPRLITNGDGFLLWMSLLNPAAGAAVGAVASVLVQVSGVGRAAPARVASQDAGHDQPKSGVGSGISRRTAGTTGTPSPAPASPEGCGMLVGRVTLGALVGAAVGVGVGFTALLIASLVAPADGNDGIGLLGLVVLFYSVAGCALAGAVIAVWRTRRQR